MADLKAQIEISADASGVEVGVQKAKRSLADLAGAAASTGKEAAAGLAPIGEGGDAAAQKVSRATSSMIGSIQRTTAALEAGGRSSAEYFESIASQRGVNTGALKPYLDQLKAVNEATAAKIIEDRAAAVAATEQAAAIRATTAAQQAFLASLNQQVATKTLDPAGVLAYKASLLGVSKEADAQITKLRELEAAAASKATQDRAAAAAADKEAASIRSTTAAQQAFLSALKQQADTKGLDASGVLAYRAQLLGVSKEAEGLIAKLKGGAFSEFGVSAAAAANNLRMVGPQFTDIVTSIQGGQKPLTVLIQQGGQLKDIFGGVAPAAKALGGYILGLINPFTVAAAAAASLGYAFVSGAKENTAYAKALILSGNAAGLTVGQMAAMAKAVSAVAGTQGKAAEAIAAFAQSGQVAGSVLGDAALAAVKFERTTGTAISETVKQFAELGKTPLDASVKLNESLNYLTTTTYQQIKALEDQGRATEAAALAQKLYAEAIDSRADQITAKLGFVERAWLAIKDASKGALDAVLNVGRPTSRQDELAKAQSELSARQQRSALGGGSNAAINDSFEKGNDALRERIRVLSKSILVEGEAADATRLGAEQVKARIKFDKDGEQFAQNSAKREREITKARNEGAAAGASQVEIEKRVADIREKYKDPKKPADNNAAQEAKAQLAFDLDQIQKSSDALVNIYGNAEKSIEAQRRAGLIDEREYYQAKRDLLNLTAQEQESSIQKRIDRLKEESFAGKTADKDRIDNARKVIDLEGQLAKLRENTAAGVKILAIEESSRLKAIQQGYRDAEAAAQEYLDTIKRGNERVLDGLGAGNVERDRTSGRAQIEDRYDAQRRALEKSRRDAEFAGTFGPEAQAKYTDELDRIRRFQGAALMEYDAYFKRRREKEDDFATGVQEAMANYRDSAGFTAKNVEGVFTRAFGGMEDALIKFVQTGKLSFKGMIDSFVADIIRLTVQQQVTKPLSDYINGAAGGSTQSGGSSGGGFLASAIGLIGGFFGGGNYSANAGTGYATAAGISGGRAIGGPVAARGLYQVNEKGPEVLSVSGKQYLMMGAQSGEVKANGSSGQPQVNVTNVFHIDQPASRATQSQVATSAGRGIQRALARGNA